MTNNISKRYLIREWAEYLINNQYASESNNGRLEYHKPITARLLIQFILLQTTGLSRNEIIQAIKSVRSSTKPVSETVVRLNQNRVLSEVEVVKIFDAVVKMIESKKVQSTEDSKTRNLKRITDAIDRSLSQAQRIRLWKSLKSIQSTTVTEENLTDDEINGIFDRVEKLNQSTWMGSRSYSRRDAIESSWEQMGKPKDSSVLRSILDNAGLTQSQIKSAMERTKDEVDAEDSDGNDTILQLADYIIKQGLSDAVIQHLTTSHGLKEMRSLKPVLEDQIEEGSELHHTLKADQYVRLLKHLRAKATDNIPITHIKNQIVKSWKRGMKNIKHIDRLLNRVDMTLHSIIK